MVACRVVATEREIRFVVTEGEPPAGGTSVVQAYLLRKPALRVRLTGRRRGTSTLKFPRANGDLEFEFPVPAWGVRRLLRLPLPRVEKTRLVDGELEIDVYSWPRKLVVVECELGEDATFDLRDAEARGAWMAARRPAWVIAWHDVTHDRSLSASALAEPRP